MVRKTHLEPFTEPLMVPPVGQPKNLFFLRVNNLEEHETVITSTQLEILRLSVITSTQNHQQNKSQNGCTGYNIDQLLVYRSYLPSMSCWNLQFLTQ